MKILILLLFPFSLFSQTQEEQKAIIYARETAREDSIKSAYYEGKIADLNQMLNVTTEALEAHRRAGTLTGEIESSMKAEIEAYKAEIAGLQKRAKQEEKRKRFWRGFAAVEAAVITTVVLIIVK